MRIEFKDEDQKARFDIITPTRYNNETCLGTLLMLDDVNWMFNQLGWRHFLKHPTYERDTLEYFTSVKFEFGRRVRGHFGSIYFKLFNLY